MEEAQSLCNRVALMDHGKLEEVSTPSALIESLGAYAVDEMTADGTQNHYSIHDRKQSGIWKSLQGRRLFARRHWRTSL